ncbi:MAG TPA: hypothetical protein VFE07_07335 [Marmoricola sp.]|nr:hypothetical protein [Marmoricola sp.]
MRKTQKFAIVGGTVGVLMAGGIAFAAWTSTGTGTGTVTAGHQQDLVVTAGSASELYPTGFRTVDVQVKNVNPYPVSIDQLELNGAVADQAIGDDDGPACDPATDVTALVVASGATTYIAPGATVTVSNAVKLSMDANAADNCQLDEFTVGVKATAHSVPVAP